MCTALLLVRAHPTYPLIVASNRDEFHRRPARGPVVLEDEPRAVGGLDEEKGGSWMGVTRSGFLALLTNQPEPGGPRAGARSRGELVREALRRGARGGPGAVRSWLGELDARQYSSFNLLFGDASRLEVGYGRAGAAPVEFEAVPQGLHVLPNGRLDEPGHRKVRRALELGRPLLERASTWGDLARGLARILADHDRPSLEEVADPGQGARFPREVVRELYALCIHTPGYGTRSASIAALEPGRTAHLLWAPGPPCTAAFETAEV